MKIVVIDNYDSFTYNLVHAIKKISGLPVITSYSIHYTKLYELLNRRSISAAPISPERMRQKINAGFNNLTA